MKYEPDFHAWVNIPDPHIPGWRVVGRRMRNDEYDYMHDPIEDSKKKNDAYQRLVEFVRMVSNMGTFSTPPYQAAESLLRELGEL